jgi:glycosyltransferase involved in cell wall biosynthesis
MFYGEWAKSWYASHGFKAERLFVIRNSLDYDQQRQIRESVSQSDIEKVRQQFGVEDHDARLLFHSGRLESKKKLTMLFDALKVMKAKGRRVKLLLVGKGREEERLKEDVRQKGIEDRVVFYGACYDESILGRLITAADLTVVPGVVGLIAMHSLVYGTPLLTCYNTAYEHCPEVEAVIEGQTGCYFKDGDIDDLVNKIEYMLYENPCKSRMAEACKKMIDQNFTPQYQEKMIIQALNYVLPADKQISCPSK